MRKAVLLVVLLVLTVGAISVFVLLNKPSLDDSQSSQNLDEESGEIVIDLPEQIISSPKVQKLLPPYNGEPIAITGNDPIINQFPEELVGRERKFLANLSESLKNNPDDYDGWIAVGVHKKFFNNYLGARDAWEYAKSLVPEQPQAYLNLANLYAYHIRDIKKAEENYLAAIERDSRNIYNTLYDTANFYRDFGFKEKALAYYQKVLEFEPDNEPIKVEIDRLK